MAPDWSHRDPRLFALLLSKILESEQISSKLHNWINLIFGSKQKGREAFNSVNTFHPLTYENSLDYTTL